MTTPEPKRLTLEPWRLVLELSGTNRVRFMAGLYDSLKSICIFMVSLQDSRESLHGSRPTSSALSSSTSPDSDPGSSGTAFMAVQHASRLEVKLLWL